MIRLLIAILAFVPSLALAADRPNIIWIMADDLGYGDIGCFGQKQIKTPRLDRMAAEGMRFTSSYVGTSVCAPSRASLMTGLHMGHCPIRANREVQPEGQMPLPKSNRTIAELLQTNGYRTGIFGKWGLGFPGSGSEPNNRGFSEFFGYNCQRQAHSFYPPYLWHNDQRIELPGNAEGKREQYSHDVIVERMLKWVAEQKDAPFFLYWADTIPHQKWEVPEQGEYAEKDWPEVEKNFAAMITRFDRNIGRLLDLLAEMKLDERTLVFFVSDNGACFDYDGHKMEFFNSNGELRGAKRGMYEGSLRSPSIARWPGKIEAGQVSDVPWAFWDFYPTAAELAGVSVPADQKLDGKSIVPLLQGQSFQPHDSFYWELHEGATKQAVRWGNFKAVRNAINGPIELYDLSVDPAEANDLAATRQELVAHAEKLMAESRVDDENFPLKAPGKAVR